jgi:hypothetical protein
MGLLRIFTHSNTFAKESESHQRILFILCLIGLVVHLLLKRILSYGNFPFSSKFLPQIFLTK